MKLLCLAAIPIVAACAMPVLSESMINEKTVVTFVEKDFSLTLEDSAWRNAEPVRVATYWNGRPVPAGRRFEARLLWSATALYVRFECEQSEPLVVSEKPDTSKKRMQLWDTDVAEIFLAPDPKQPRRYLEFEVAPTGEWIDVAIHFEGDERKTDWHFRSGMSAAARIEDGKVVMAMKVPWSAFGVTPKPGDVWRGNLFRCVGKDPDRGYLAWRPTMTKVPSFHVPERFGEFEFVR